MAKKSKLENKDLPIASEEIQVEKTETERVGSDGLSKKRTKCEIFSRVVGYYAPVQQWNEGKQAEFEERKTFKVKNDKKSKKVKNMKKSKKGS